jgi:hypothetical protein
MPANERVLPLEPGTFVEVRNRFDGSWCPGFEIDRAVGDEYIVRRRRDGALLPKAFPSGMVRALLVPD